MKIAMIASECEPWAKTGGLADVVDALSRALGTPEPSGLGHDVDVYLLEAAFVDGRDTGLHLTPRVAGRVARDCGCGHLVLTHLYPETEATDVEAAARREYDGPLTVATDQLRLEL